MPARVTTRPHERPARASSSVHDDAASAARATVYLAIALFLAGFWGALGYAVWSLLA